METITIKDKDNNITLFLNRNSINGYSCYDTDVLEYLKLFKLSDNNTYMGKYNQYDIVLDNNTGLKHYIYNNIDNIYLLYLNNGEYSVRCRGSKKNKIKSNSKIFKISSVIISTSLLGIVLINGMLLSIDKPKMVSYAVIEDYDLDDIKNMIYSSKNLNSDEKDYLYNEAYLTDVLNTINDSNYVKLKYSKNFKNIDIRKDYNRFESDDTALGYYDSSKPNILYVRNYEELDKLSKDTVAHEFVHLCQEIEGYNLIIESCAEIISNEYYPIGRINSYYEPVRLVKKLMEIIGSEPIWKYCYTGDFSEIENRVKPYLSDVDYEEFLNNLDFDYDDDESNEKRYESMDNILSILYKNIYNDDISNNIVISMIDKHDDDLYRYYFNDRKESFYYAKSGGEYRTLTYKEAMDYEIIYITAVYKEPIDYNEAFKLADKHSLNLCREIDFTHNDISLIRTTSGFMGHRITAMIDGVYYEEKDVDELAKKGIIKINYYYTERKELTYDDLLNGNYREGSELVVTKGASTVLNEESVTTFMKDKVFLLSANDNYDFDNHSLTLK